MTRGERWKRFLEAKGWLVNEVISGGDDGTLQITVGRRLDPDNKNSVTFPSAMLLPEFDILCYETPTGTVFYQWDDIVHIKIEPRRQKKGWL